MMPAASDFGPAGGHGLARGVAEFCSVVFVPARSNDFQKVVTLIHQHLPESSVRESAFLLDRHTQAPREVDVVIDADVVGYPIIVSLECRDWAKPQTVEWVDAMDRKHESLPTNQLVLMSSSGFTKGARDQARASGIELVNPFEMTNDVAKAIADRVAGLRMKGIALTIVEMVAHIDPIDGQHPGPVYTNRDRDRILFSSEHVPLTTVRRFTDTVVQRTDLNPLFLQATPDDRTLMLYDESPSYTLPNSDELLRFYLETTESSRLRAVSRIEVALDARITDSDIPMTHGQMRGTDFSYGRVDALDKNVLVVVTHAPEGLAKISLAFEAERPTPEK